MKKGRIPGSFVSEVMNLHSRRLYLIASYPTSDYWMTNVLPMTRVKTFFSSKNVADPSHPLASFSRNSRKEAFDVHAAVEHCVARLKESEWTASFPSAAPPDGYSAGAIAKLRSVVGDSILRDKLR